MKLKSLMLLGVFFLALVAGLCDMGILSFIWDPWDLQYRPRPELHIAVDKGDKDKVEQLIKEGANIDELAAIFGRGGRETPLCVAAHAGKADIVEVLIGHGADVNKECPLRI